MASASLQAASLIQRLTRGDHKALGEFYDLYAGLVNGLAFRILRDPAEAEDTVQEVFVQAWQQASRFDASRGTPEAWLCTINVPLSRRRSPRARSCSVSSRPTGSSWAPAGARGR